MNKYVVETPFVVGQKVLARNYRKAGEVWEEGTITHIKANLKPDLTYGLGYEVLLDRRSERKDRKKTRGFIRLSLCNIEVKPVAI